MMEEPFLVDINHRNRSRDILVLVILLIVFTFRSHGSTKGVMSELRAVGSAGC